MCLVKNGRPVNINFSVCTRIEPLDVKTETKFIADVVKVDECHSYFSSNKSLTSINFHEPTLMKEPNLQLSKSSRVVPLIVCYLSLTFFG